MRLASGDVRDHIVYFPQEPHRAIPLAPLQSNASNVESVALVCGPRGCVRTVPAYRRGVVVVRRPYVRRYGYHRGYRRY